ncbi:hypothetical protein D3C81_1176950 [compost metagenome]
MNPIYTHIRVDAALGPIHIKSPVCLVVVDQCFLLTFFRTAYFYTEFLSLARIDFHHNFQHVAFDILNCLVCCLQIFVLEINYFISSEALQFFNRLDLQFIVLIKAQGYWQRQIVCPSGLIFGLRRSYILHHGEHNRSSVRGDHTALCG